MSAAAHGSGEALMGALEYAGAGYAVGPVTIRWGSDGKKHPEFHTNWRHPRDGEVSISSDTDQIMAWAREFPGCGWHMPCGPNGVVVAEGDRRRARDDGTHLIKDGVTAWQDAGGPTPAMVVRTPNDGEHWYFAAPTEEIRNSEDNVAGVPGVDVRGDGGTVFISGTRVEGHPRGADAIYVADRVVPAAELSALPGDWAATLRAAHKGTGSGPSLALDGPVGFSMVHQFHDRAWMLGEVDKVLARAANARPDGSFRDDLYTVTVNLFKAAGAGVIAADRPEQVAHDMVHRFWPAPNWQDRDHVRRARRDALRDPWRVRPDATDAPDAVADWPTPPTSTNSGPGVVPEPPGNHWEPPHGEQGSGAPAGGSAGGSAGGPDGSPERERTSWALADLADVLGEEIEQEPPPCVLRRTDGAPLLYGSRVNGVLGESESGKSWVAQYAVVQVIDEGGHALYFDFEDSKAGVVGRLRQLGAKPPVIGDRFGYVGPQDPLSLAGGAAWEDWVEVVQSRPWSVIVLDGFNVAMDLLGLDMDNNREAGRFLTQFLRPMARESGAALLYVDHVPKDPQGRGKGGIGAQAKRAYTDGLCMRAEIDTPFGRGQNGRLKLTVDKDRLGHVRGIADEGTGIGMFKLTSTDKETGAVEGEIVGFSAAGPKEPTRIMEAVSLFLQGSPEEWFSTNAIDQGVPGRRATITDALNHLTRRGCTERQTAANRKIEYRFAKRFTAFVADVQGAVVDPDEPDENDDDGYGD